MQSRLRPTWPPASNDFERQLQMSGDLQQLQAAGGGLFAGLGSIGGIFAKK